MLVFDQILQKKIETEVKEKKLCEDKRNELNIECKKSEDAINALQKKITTLKSRQVISVTLSGVKVR